MKIAHIIFSCVLMAFLLIGGAKAEPIDGVTQPVETSEEDTVKQYDWQINSETCSEIEPPKTVEEQADALDAESVKDALPQEAEEILGNISMTDLQMGDSGLNALYESIKENFFGIFKNALRSAVKILTIVLLCSVASSSMSEGGVRDMVSLGGIVAVSAVAISDVHSFLGMGMETLFSLSDFSKVLLPVMCTAAVSAGAITSAAAKYAATALFMDVLITVAVNVILPLISVYLAAVIAGAVMPKDTLGNISKMLKWICTTSLTLLMLAFTTYLGMTGLISGKADQVATKITKTALGTVLPVVGGILSDTAETLVAGAGLIRNAIGVFGFLAVAAVCLTPFLTLGIHYLVYKGTAALSESLTDKRMADLISSVGTAFGMLLGLVGAGGIMLFFSVISSMKAVNAL